MNGILKALYCELVALTAPVVCLFYRRGWFLTPDDQVSPFGSYEPAMVRIYAKYGKFFGDWWWLGVRNRAYGLAYAMKPQHFKDLTTYANCAVTVEQKGLLRTITVDGFSEYMVSLGLVHILAGYRLRPVADEAQRNAPCRAINMDARPILSVRFGAKDD